MKLNTNIIYLGTPDFAVLPLIELARLGYRVIGVFTQPDRPKGRGKELSKSPVKTAAESLNISVYQPASKTELASLVRELKPDAAIVAAYGMIIPVEALSVPKHGFINIHGSLLPKYRGASPVQEAILSGDSETGITIMHMDAGMDTGAIISKHPIAIEDTDRTDTLMTKLSVLGAKAIAETLPLWINGNISEYKQDDGAASYCKKITKEDGHITWKNDAITIERQIRAYNPWPKTFFFAGDTRYLIHEAKITKTASLKPGIISVQTSRLTIGTKTTDIVIELIQPENKRTLSGDTFAKNNLSINGKLAN